MFNEQKSTYKRGRDICMCYCVFKQTERIIKWYVEFTFLNLKLPQRETFGLIYKNIYASLLLKLEFNFKLYVQFLEFYKTVTDFSVIFN